MTARTRKQKPNPLAQDIVELGHTLQEAGRSLVKLATKTVSAAAEDAIGKTDEALVAARGRLKKVRMQIHKTPSA
ncbi:MAG TPA: hypothetical protein VLU43_07720 [Anaeromyxobacteraceae bacterium]|nr:hypothetical protein [Anaeromyxobacteraceae bacterium]